jgi:hypothetical protein
MTERFCEDCPCLDPDSDCRLNPTETTISDPDIWYCYSGRQIIEQQATWNALKNCYPKEAGQEKERDGASGIASR